MRDNSPPRQPHRNERHSRTPAPHRPNHPGSNHPSNHRPDGRASPRSRGNDNHVVHNRLRGNHHRSHRNSRHSGRPGALPSNRPLPHNTFDSARNNRHSAPHAGPNRSRNQRREPSHSRGTAVTAPHEHSPAGPGNDRRSRRQRRHSRHPNGPPHHHSSHVPARHNGLPPNDPRRHHRPHGAPTHHNRRTPCGRQRNHHESSEISLFGSARHNDSNHPARYVHSGRQRTPPRHATRPRPNRRPAKPGNSAVIPPVRRGADVPANLRSNNTAR